MSWQDRLQISHRFSMVFHMIAMSPKLTATKKADLQEDAGSTVQKSDHGKRTPPNCTA